MSANTDVVIPILICLYTYKDYEITSHEKAMF